ncbi:MAG: peptidoglycan DD-metalloendopeptidase family protein, partial [Solirubrobacterales bacterium]|nr:peptidoglycan DD-metalloendopeptidase family protein [Solirubrobacterales bacterium]
MRAKIALIVVLASFLALSALGVGMAAADSVGESAAAEPSTATTTTAIPSLGAPACANGLDDDGDGLVDLADPDCTSPTGSSEATVAPSGAGVAAPVPAPEAAPSPGAHKPKSGGVEEGTAIGSGEGGGVTHNEAIGDSSGGGGTAGGVRAPSATGGGDQPLTEGTDGGSQFGSGGAPTAANPTTTIAPFGPAPIGVPNFVIDSFEIPPFLLPIYQACGTEYGIPWEVLASINKIESAFGTNLNVSSAGAVGWMQFLPSSWEMYGVDANGDGRKDPYNPVDAICAAASYLKTAGGDKDLYKA